MTVPVDYQAKRTFQGMLPKYYHKVTFQYPAPDTDIITFWRLDFANQISGIVPVIITAVIQVTYASAAKEDLLTVERTFYDESIG